MKSLYSRLAGQWDELFPPDEERQSFLAGRLQIPGKTVQIIDLGCGTGATARFLAGLGFQVLATDLDPEMISISGTRRLPNLKYRVADMNETLLSADSAKMNAVLCLGNTLPHLQDLASLQTFFSEACRVLIPGGRLILQILNYERIRNAGNLTMPDLTGDDLVFRRSQNWDEDIQKVRFITEVSSGDEHEKREHLMQPVTEPELTRLAIDTGMSLLEQGCDWNGSPVRSDCPWNYLIYGKGTE